MSRKHFTTSGSSALQPDETEEREQRKGGAWAYIKEKLMPEDPVLKAATQFESRLRAGEARLLSKHESDRELDAIRKEQIEMRRKIDEVLKKPVP